MKRLLIIVLFGIALGVAQARDHSPTHLTRRSSNPRLPVVLPAYLFSFAPVSGIGLGGACDCADVISEDGMHGNFTRSTIATCTKHSWWSGIQPGDLLSCPVDKPVIEPGGDGTGPLRYLAEKQLYNYVIYSENFNVGNWGKNNNGPGDCTVSPPDAGLDPFGGSGATRIMCPATAAGEFAQVYDFDGTTGQPSSGSIYVRSYGSTPQTVTFVPHSNTTAYPVTCTPGGFSMGWMRCASENIPNSLQYGVFGNVAAGGSPAFDVLIFGAQFEIGEGATSYIRTNGAAGSRGESILSFNTSVPQGSDLSISANVLAHHLPVASTLASLSNSAINQFSANQTTNLTCHLDHATVISNVATGNSFVDDSIDTTACFYNGDFWLAATLNGIQFDAGTGANAPTDYNVFWIGTLFTGGNQPNGHLGPVTIFSSSQKDIYLYGDGIVDGFPTYQCLPQNVLHTVLGNFVSVQNNANTGDRIEDCHTKWTATVNSIRASGPKRAVRSYLMWQCGGNGLLDGGTDTAAMAQEIKDALLDARDAGAIPMYATITSFVGVPAKEALSVAINADMLAFCTANGFEYSDSRTATGGVPCDPALRQCADGGVHMQDAGCVAETMTWKTTGSW